MTNLTDEGLREIVVQICEKVCCSDDCHCRRDDDGYEFTCESCFILDWLERVRDAAKKEEREACAKVAENIEDALISPSSIQIMGRIGVAKAIRQMDQNKEVK